MIVPMPNAYGYAENISKESTLNTGTGRAVFRVPGRDFPYNSSSPTSCLNTVASRALFRLFTDNIFVSGITFHNFPDATRTAPVIAYPWGGLNHRTASPDFSSLEAPDFKAFYALG